MNRVTVRGFQTTAQRAINYIGSVTLADVVDQNGPEWGDPVNDACLDVEKKVCLTILPCYVPHVQSLMRFSTQK